MIWVFYVLSEQHPQVRKGTLICGSEFSIKTYALIPISDTKMCVPALAHVGMTLSYSLLVHVGSVFMITFSLCECLLWRPFLFILFCICVSIPQAVPTRVKATLKSKNACTICLALQKVKPLYVKLTYN